MQNKLIKLLSDQAPFCGITLMCGSTRVTEILARSNCAFLMVDQQHGEFSKASATDSTIKGFSRELAMNCPAPFVGP